MPLLSILITCYNLENYIEECLKSIVDQDADDYEIVLVDNGSSDKSRNICGSYAKKYPQINYIQLEGEPIIGRAHVRALREAKGEYCHFIDGDDKVAKNCYEDICQIIKTKKPDIVFGSFECLMEKGATRYLRDAVIDVKKVNHVSYQKALDYLTGVSGFHGMPWRYIFRNLSQKKKEELFAEPKKFKQAIGHDEIFSIKLLSYAKSIYYYDKPFYYYRMRSSQALTTTITTDHYKAYFYNVPLMLEQLNRKAELQNYIFSRVRTMIKLFSAGCDLLLPQEIEEVAEVIGYSKSFRRLSKISEPNSLYDFVKRYGAYTGLQLFRTHESARVVEMVRKRKEKDIYIFPTGNCGEGTARRLEKAGIKVCGFLDNSEHKAGMDIYGIRCHLPVYMKEALSKGQDNILVVISTVYDTLVPELKKQLIELGMPEDQILVNK